MKKENINLKEKNGGIRLGVWREERKRGNDINII